MVGAGIYLIYYWSLGTGSELLALRADQLFEPVLLLRPPMGLR